MDDKHIQSSWIYKIIKYNRYEFDFPLGHATEATGQNHQKFELCYGIICMSWHLFRDRDTEEEIN